MSNNSPHKRASMRSWKDHLPGNLRTKSQQQYELMQHLRRLLSGADFQSIEAAWLQQNCLHLSTSSAIQATRLRYRGVSLLKALPSKWALKEVRVKLARNSATQKRPTPTRNNRMSMPDVTAHALRDIAADCEDEALTAALTRLANCAPRR